MQGPAEILMIILGIQGANTSSGSGVRDPWKFEKSAKGTLFGY